MNTIILDSIKEVRRELEQAIAEEAPPHMLTEISLRLVSLYSLLNLDTLTERKVA